MLSPAALALLRTLRTATDPAASAFPGDPLAIARDAHAALPPADQAPAVNQLLTFVASRSSPAAVPGTLPAR